jgi:hypothetical protein
LSAESKLQGGARLMSLAHGFRMAVKPTLAGRAGKPHS